jgi:hypothetical protein
VRGRLSSLILLFLATLLEKTQKLKCVSTKGFRQRWAPSDLTLFVVPPFKIFVFMAFLLLEIKVKGLRLKLKGTLKIARGFILVTS